VAESPWIKFYTSDFLTGVADLQAEEIGIYTVLLALIWDKGGPIPDDPAWLARRAGTSTRKFNQVRNRLIELGKLEARDGLLGNRRAIQEVGKRDGKSAQARNAALTRWRSAGEPELPLEQAEKPTGTDLAPVARARGGDYLGNNRPKNAETPGDKDVLISGKNDTKPQKTADIADADASSPVARARSQSPETRITSQPDSLQTPRESRLDDRDLQALYDAVCEAAGFATASPAAIDRAYRQVQAWRDAGIDFEKVVLPTIRHTVANSSDPTRVLGRFDKAIRHEHARSAAKAANGSAYVAPASPITVREDEEPVFALIRQDLLERMGAPTFCLFVNHVRFEAVDMAGSPLRDGKPRTPMKVVQLRPGGHKLMDSDRVSVLRNIAAKHGFGEIW